MENAVIGFNTWKHELLNKNAELTLKQKTEIAWSSHLHDIIVFVTDIYSALYLCHQLMHFSMVLIHMLAYISRSLSQRQFFCGPRATTNMDTLDVLSAEYGYGDVLSPASQHWHWTDKSVTSTSTKGLIMKLAHGFNCSKTLNVLSNSLV